MRAETAKDTSPSGRSSGAISPAGSPARRMGRLPIGGVLLGVGILVGGIGGFLVAKTGSKGGGARPEVSRPLPVRVETVERQVAARRLAALRIPAFDPLVAPETAVDGFASPLVLSPPYEAVDSVIFDTSTHRIRLGRVRPIGRTEICQDANRMRFACGLMGRAHLKSVLGQSPIVCDRLFLAPSPSPDRLVADCRNEQGMLSEAMVRAGFALPAALAGSSIEAAAADAVLRRAGVWAGPYVGPDADPGDADERGQPIGSQPSSAASNLGLPVGGAPTRSTSDPMRDPGRSGAGSPEAAEGRKPAKTGKPRVGPARGETLDTVRIDADPKRVGPAVREGGGSIAPSSAAARGSGQPAGGVVAGPILPPPPGLAEKLGGGGGPRSDDASSRNSSSDR